MRYEKQYFLNLKSYYQNRKQGEKSQVLFPNLLNTMFRMSRIRVISFIVRVLKKAVNLESSLSKAWFLDERASSSKKVLRGVFIDRGIINKLHHGCRYRGDE